MINKTIGFRGTLFSDTPTGLFLRTVASQAAPSTWGHPRYSKHSLIDSIHQNIILFHMKKSLVVIHLDRWIMELKWPIEIHGLPINSMVDLSMAMLNNQMVYGFVWKCRVPPQKPNGFADQTIPFLNGYLFGNIAYFQTNPNELNIFKQTIWLWLT